jgi:DNA-directed RNA polymerase
MLEHHSNPKAIVKLPVVFDATFRGIQHFAALLTDMCLASKVNILFDENIKPERVQDLYSDKINPINMAINEYGIIYKDNINLSVIKLDRSIIKQYIMTKTYNVSIYVIKEQIANKLEAIQVPKEKSIKYTENSKLLLPGN